jgi:hypothetical protein
MRNATLRCTYFCRSLYGCYLPHARTVIVLFQLALCLSYTARCASHGDGVEL